ncbi:MAG: glycosyltransferase [Phycisphaeraceae bacterium]|nr:glycosyltransferase [Phycisphaeraceae bacterium]
MVTGTGGGPDKTILLSAPFLAHTRYCLTAAYLHPPGDTGFESIRGRAEALGSPLVSIPDRGPLDFRVLRRLIRLCRDLKVDIWHGHDYKTNFLGILVRCFHRMKLVTTLHGWVKHTRKTPLYYAIDRFSLRFYDHVIAVSEDLYHEASRLGVPASRLTLVHNAIDERTFNRQGPPADAPLRRQSGTPAGRLVVGAMGRLSPEKGFDTLIEAFGQVIAGGVDAELWIGGEGDMLESLRRRVSEAGLDDRVKLRGFVSNTKDFYEALDCFVLSSLREGLPNVILEAAAMRVPIVSTRIAGVGCMLTDGRNALMCDPGDTRALARSMSQMLADAALRRRLAENARDLIERRYGFSHRMARIRAIYDRVLGLPMDDQTPIVADPVIDPSGGTR